VRDLKENHADMVVSRAPSDALFSEAAAPELLGAVDSGPSRACLLAALCAHLLIILRGAGLISLRLSACRAVVLHRCAAVLHRRAVAPQIAPRLRRLGSGSVGCPDLLVSSPRLSSSIVRWVFPRGSVFRLWGCEGEAGGAREPY
jgi:hypothetical protein